MVVAESVGGSGVSNAEVVVVVDDEATVPKQLKHLRRLKSPLKQPQMLYGAKMGQVAESYGGFADDMVDVLCKDAKIPKLLWSQMMLEPIQMDGGCQQLLNELKNVKIGLRMWKI